MWVYSVKSNYQYIRCNNPILVLIKCTGIKVFNVINKFRNMLSNQHKNNIYRMCYVNYINTRHIRLLNTKYTLRFALGHNALNTPTLTPTTVSV